MKLRELGRSVGSKVLRQVGRVASNVQESRPLPVDLLESDEAYLAVFDAPGATQSDVQVRFADGTIYVRIDRFRERREAFDLQFPGRGLSLDGSVDLPAGARVDPQAATATLTDAGTLEIHVPKVDPDVGSDDRRESVDPDAVPGDTPAPSDERPGEWPGDESLEVDAEP